MSKIKKPKLYRIMCKPELSLGKVTGSFTFLVFAPNQVQALKKAKETFLESIGKTFSGADVLGVKITKVVNIPYDAILETK